MDAQREARGLVAVLGWDWWDGIQALRFQSADVLNAYIAILAPEYPDDTERTKALSVLGMSRARFWLDLYQDADRLIQYAAAAVGDDVMTAMETSGVRAADDVPVAWLVGEI